ncbi:MAG: diadenylate cyclase domain-containing protein, partial [Halobacteriales archaeon]|nr:diadenylate cyclase domain-containing protein [Halobacteriales archaeon]
MSDLRELLDGLVSGVDAVVLFSPSASEFERYGEGTNGDVIVVGRENTVGAGSFIELPLEFDDIRDRIRYGLEGAMSADLIDDGDVVTCGLKTFAGELDSVIRVRADESSLSSGIYELFVNSRAEASVIRDVLAVVIELGKKGQKGEPVGALFVVGDAGKVMNKSRPLSYNPLEKSHVQVGDSIVNVILNELSRLVGAFVISEEGKIVTAYRYHEAT